MEKLLVAVCVLEAEGRFPLIKFKRNYLKGYWGLPGGKLDDGEHLPEAAIREITEEIGCQSTFLKFHGLVDEFAFLDDREVRAVLLVTSLRPEGIITFEDRDSEEGTVRWFTKEDIEAARDDIVPSDYRIFHDMYLSGEGGYYRCRQTIKAGRAVLDEFARV